MRSRVAGLRLAIAFGASSLAVYLLGPTVKAAGFSTLLIAMAAISACTALFVALLPGAVPWPSSGIEREDSARRAVVVRDSLSMN
jgi:hypothetical protein